MGYGYSVLIKAGDYENVSSASYNDSEFAAEWDELKQMGFPERSFAYDTNNKINSGTDGNGSILIIIGSFIGAALVIGLAVFVYRRIRRFSRVAVNDKSEGEDKRE